MKPITLRIATLSAPILLAASFASSSAAQERVFPPLVESADIKTAPEPSRPPDPVVPRPSSPTRATPGTNPSSRAGAPARSVDPNAPVPAGFRVDHSRMHYDAPGDGSLWARGASYKASFDGAGVTFFPLFGGEQPRHLPLALSPDVVTLGGEPLEIATSSAAHRTDDSIALDRKSFVERYELGTQCLEQVFVFGALNGSGDLLVRIPIAPAEEPIEVVATGTGLEIRSELGSVSYGRAVAIDGDGRRADAETTFADGAITIRVDEQFLSGAKMPLVIDPIVTPLLIDTTTFVNQFSDVAYDATTQRWICAYGELATAGDQDVYYTMLNAAGASMWGGYLNVTDSGWWSPSCANLNAADQFLVVCQVNVGLSSTIRGRTVQANISSVGNEFFISGSESGDKLFPDVGGDPFGLSPSYYCVVYQREFSGSDDDILVRLVTSSSTLVGTGPVYLSNSGGTHDTFPSIARSNNAGDWMIAWQRDLSSTSAEIWAGSVTYAGAIVLTPFQVTSGNWDIGACVSTALAGFPARNMIAFVRWYGIDWDVHAVVQAGTTPIAAVDVSTLHNDAFFLEDQWVPEVDSDGVHFLLGYSERPIGAQQYNVYVDELYLIGNTLGLSQTRVPLATTGTWEIGPAVASTRGSGAEAKRYLLSWTKEATASSGNYDIHAALFDGTDAGSTSQFCAGDATGGVCPCLNYGTGGAGCANSVNTGGARLTVSGSVAPAFDTAVLSASQMPGTAVCLFFQGTTAGSPATFGDGLRCTAGGVVRLGTKTASAGVANFPGVGDPALHVKGAVPPSGGMRAYQVWYRNAAAFCTSATFNLTNGVIINWSN